MIACIDLLAASFRKFSFQEPEKRGLKRGASESSAESLQTNKRARRSLSGSCGMDVDVSGGLSDYEYLPSEDGDVDMDKTSS